MTDPETVLVTPARDFPLEVRRSDKARRLSVVVHPDRVVLVVPRGIALEGPRGALAFLESKRDWARRAFVRVRSRDALRQADAVPPPPPDDGATFLHRGSAWPLAVREADVGRARIEATDVLSVTVPRGLTDDGRRRTVAVALRNWARAGLLAESRRLAAELSARLGVAARDVRLLRARTRWGSCSPDGVVRLNVALAAAPPDLLEYLVAHEVTHLRWRGHGPRFYAALERLVPDWAERRARLRAFERAHPHLLEPR
jgi:predicted metal-dependent hydrolase